MPFSTTAKNAMLGALNASVTLKLYNGDPFGAGSEITGSGYSAKAGTLAAASGGERRLNADVDFGFSSGAAWTQATHVATFDGATLIAADDLATPHTTDATNKMVLRANSTDYRLRLTDS
jgi:hypothetical protein